MQSARFGRPFARTILAIVLVVLLAYGSATAIRYGLIERSDLGPTCDATGAPWWCSVRMMVIRAFLHQVFGVASVACAAAAAWRRSAILAWSAVVVGTWGMVLYDFTLSAAGMLAGALVVARLQGEWREHASPEQHAG
jgi:hypothetical protein